MTPGLSVLPPSCQREGGAMGANVIVERDVMGANETE